MATERPMWGPGEIIEFHKRMQQSKAPSNKPRTEAELYLTQFAPGVTLGQEAFGLELGPAHAFGFFFGQEIEKRHTHMQFEEAHMPSEIEAVFRQHFEKQTEQYVGTSVVKYTQGTTIDTLSAAMYFLALEAAAVGAAELFYVAKDPPTEQQLGELVNSVRDIGVGYDEMVQLMNQDALVRQQTIRQLLGNSGMN